MIPIITPTELQSELASANPPVLIDVREPDELEISNMPSAVNIPMSEIPSRMTELDPGANLVIVCRTGNRSGRVTAYLLQSGFQRVRNLVTGINGWATEVDPTVRRY